ncbi:hypothetical protein VKT23_008352 [Stygiomarasmius scandens]|uniref:Uncharacterized protein n=1 Tax=Marasmiellus scandens TaxID=2682957 RepID=A0ABR1JIW4_9AGAR
MVAERSSTISNAADQELKRFFARRLPIAQIHSEHLEITNDNEYLLWCRVCGGGKNGKNGVYLTSLFCTITIKYYSRHGSLAIKDTRFFMGDQSKFGSLWTMLASMSSWSRESTPQPNNPSLGGKESDKSTRFSSAPGSPLLARAELIISKTDLSLEEYHSTPTTPTTPTAFSPLLPSRLISPTSSEETKTPLELSTLPSIKIEHTLDDTQLSSQSSSLSPEQIAIGSKPSSEPLNPNIPSTAPPERPQVTTIPSTAASLNNPTKSVRFALQTYATNPYSAISTPLGDPCPLNLDSSSISYPHPDVANISRHSKDDPLYRVDSDNPTKERLSILPYPDVFDVGRYARDSVIRMSTDTFDISASSLYPNALDMDLEGIGIGMISSYSSPTISAPTGCESIEPCSSTEMPDVGHIFLETPPILSTAPATFAFGTKNILSPSSINFVHTKSHSDSLPLHKTKPRFGLASSKRKLSQTNENEYRLGVPDADDPIRLTPPISAKHNPIFSVSVGIRVSRLGLGLGAAAAEPDARMTPNTKIRPEKSMVVRDLEDRVLTAAGNYNGSGPTDVVEPMQDEQYQKDVGQEVERMEERGEEIEERNSFFSVYSDIAERMGDIHQDIDKMGFVWTDEQFLRMLEKV